MSCCGKSTSDPAGNDSASKHRRSPFPPPLAAPPCGLTPSCAMLHCIRMTPEPVCPRCSRVLSPEDTIERDGDRVVHVDCLQPRRLTGEERVALFQYCWDHAVAECAPCSRIFRQEELLASLFGDSMDRCPQCRMDMTDAIRAHLYSCAMLPATVRRRAQETSEATQRLVKQSNQLYDRADVLMREAEALCEELKRAASSSGAKSDKGSSRASDI